MEQRPVIAQPCADRWIVIIVLAIGSIVVLTSCRTSAPIREEEPPHLILEVAEPLQVGGAGIQLSFSVAMSDGTPPPQLVPDQIEIINNEVGTDFRRSTEGGSRSEPGLPADIRLLTVFVLDFSDSIFDANAQDMIQRGVEKYLDSLLVKSPDDDADLTIIKDSHDVAIVQLGSTQSVNLTLDFTNNPVTIMQTVNDMIATGALGTTNLYKGYMLGINTAEEKEVAAELEKRAVILITDGTHQAGDEDTLRTQAMHAKEQSTIDIFTIGIDGDYKKERVQELASQHRYFYETSVEGVSIEFQRIAAGIVELARRNYVIGICTPVDIGNPTLTINVSTGDLFASETLAYSTQTLDGNTTDCDPDRVSKGKGDTMPYVNQDDTATSPVSLDPKCTDLPGQYLGDNHAECWVETENQPGCFLWTTHYHSDQITRWTGRCQEDVAEGLGTYSISAGSGHAYYEGTGELVSGKTNGRWENTWSDGDRSVGEYRDGIMHGRWIITDADGYRREGEYRNEMEHGMWIKEYPNGNSYEGELRHGIPHGWGVAVINGGRYEGQWREGCFGERDGTWATMGTTRGDCGF